MKSQAQWNPMPDKIYLGQTKASHDKTGLRSKNGSLKDMKRLASANSHAREKL
jgi:hypothetical protein